MEHLLLRETRAVFHITHRPVPLFPGPQRTSARSHLHTYMNIRLKIRLEGPNGKANKLLRPPGIPLKRAQRIFGDFGTARALGTVSSVRLFIRSSYIDVLMTRLQGRILHLCKIHRGNYSISLKKREREKRDYF